MKKRTLIYFSTLAVLSMIYFFGCKKKDFQPITNEKLIESAFYQRNPNLQEVFTSINGQRTDNYLLENIINGFRNSDPTNNRANDVTKRLGIPSWDFSTVLKNTNGFKSLATPIINGQNEVTGMILFSQENVTKIRFKIINRTNPQTRLPIYGNKEGTIFTKSSLNGLYKFFDAQTTILKQAAIKTGSNPTISQQKTSVTINYMCWNYEWSSIDPSNGDVLVGRSLQQCWYSVSYGSNNGSDVDTQDSEAGGGGGGSGEGEFNFLNSYPTPNDSIIQRLDSFPCAQLALKRLYDVNLILEDLAKNVFGVISKFHITFNKNYNMNDSLAGEYHTTFNTYDDFKGIIDLNPTHLTGSQDYITATILHESVHGYITYLRSQYVLERDTATFNLLFPVFAKTFVNRQHEEMGANYVRFMSCLLQQLNNDLTPESADALAWGGLERTQLYSTFSQPFKDSVNAINYEALKLLNPNNPRKFKKCN